MRIDFDSIRPNFNLEISGQLTDLDISGALSIRSTSSSLEALYLEECEEVDSLPSHSASEPAKQHDVIDDCEFFRSRAQSRGLRAWSTSLEPRR